MTHDSTTDPFSEVEFSIPSMVCDGCGEKIHQALMAVPGVRSVKANLWRKRIHVRYQPPRIHEAEIKDALCAAGFRVVEA